MRRRPPARLVVYLIASLMLLAVVALPLRRSLFPGQFHRVLLLAAVASMLIALLYLRAGTLALRVDRSGVFLGAHQATRHRGHPRVPGVSVPWSSVAAIAFLPAEAGASFAQVGPTVSIGVRLKPDAPLPRGLRAIAYDPRDPGAIVDELRRDLPGPLVDKPRLVRTVQAFAPHVEVIDDDGRV